MTELGLDRRLQAVIAELEAGRYQALSLDVFDTLLWRRVPEPADIFRQVGEALKAQGLLLGWVQGAQFSELRAAAEKEARAQAEARTGSREILLSDIYGALPAHIWQSAEAPTKACKVEVATESAAMLLDHDVASLLDVAKGNGVRVVLSSDTYFTREQLVGFLTAAGLAQERIPETLYISNEQGRPKWRDLFDHVLTDLAIAPDALVHVGDNVDADVTPCVARGISHVFYDRWSSLPRTRKRELPSQVAQRADWVARGGDCGLTGLRSRLVQRSPDTLEDSHRAYWTYGATTLAPLFTAYASWVQSVAGQQPGISIYGLMREGRFLAKLVGSVAKATGQDVQPGEVWLSRRAVVRAALWPDDLSLLPQAVSYCPGPSSDDVLAQLGLTRADLAGVFQDPNLFDIHAAGGMTAFLTGVSQSAELQKKLTAYSEKRRQRLLSYLDGVLDTVNDSHAILLDLGYAGTIQSVLQKILRNEGSTRKVSGLYFALNTKGRDNVLAGVNLRALVDENGYGSTLTRLLERTPDILEHACMCPEGSLDDFTDDGQPELLPSQRPASQIAQMEAMQDGILAGADAIITTLGKECVGTSAFLDHASEIVKQAMLYPTDEEVATIGSWLHEANFDLADQRALADLRVDPAQIEFGGPKSWASLGRHEVYWPQAALTKLNQTLANTSAAIAKGTVDASDFTAGSAVGAIAIIPDIGAGFDERRAVRVPLDTSVLGRGEIQTQVKVFGPEAYQALKIQWPSGRSVITVTQCAVLYRGEGEQSALDVTPKHTFGDTTQAHNGVAITQSDGTESQIDLNTTVPAWPHSLDLLLRFKYARMDPVF